MTYFLLSCLVYLCLETLEADGELKLSVVVMKTMVCVQMDVAVMQGYYCGGRLLRVCPLLPRSPVDFDGDTL